MTLLMPMTNSSAISIKGMGKMFRLYPSPLNKIMDVLGFGAILRLRKNPYQEFWALRDINLEVKKGERLGIIGRNGAGKTTLLKSITGNLTPSEGELGITGRIQALMELGTGFHPDFTGRENIHASLAYQGMSRAEVSRLEEDIIDFTELEDFIEQPVRVYSAGMYARLAFAVATAVKPEILIIDEILGAGDASFVAKCAARLKAMTEADGATLLFVSHSMPSVIEMCDRAILIQRGNLTHDGKPLEISKVYNSIIRQEEELYLRAKEHRLRKRDYRAFHSVSDDFVPLLFRLTSESVSNHKRPHHCFYQFALKSDGKNLAEIQPGSPMDNALGSLHRIIDGWGTDWQASQKDKHGYCRGIHTGPGGFHHAPFQLCLPVHSASSPVEILVDAQVDASVPVHLDLWNGERYGRVATLSPGKQAAAFAINESLPRQKATKLKTRQGVLPSLSSNLDADAQAESDSVPRTLEDFEGLLSVYGNRKTVIKDIDLVDSRNKSRRVFEVGEKMVLRLRFFAKAAMPKLYFVCSVLGEDGRPAGQVYCDSKWIGLDGVQGEHMVLLTYDPVRFGAGEYVASVGIFEDFDLWTERENTACCVIDRAVFFKVRQPEGMDKGLGACVLPVVWRCNQREYSYDPATEHATPRAA